MTFWPMLSWPDIFNFLIFCPSELGSKDLSDYKNSKEYSNYKSGWFQEINKYCIIRTECRKSHSIKDLFHKHWIILEKTAKITTCHCMAVMGETCNHVASAMYCVEAAVQISLTNPVCRSNANEWLLNRETTEPKKIKDLDFSWKDFGQKGKK